MTILKTLVKALALSAAGAHFVNNTVDFTKTAETTCLAPALNDFGLTNFVEPTQTDSFAFSQTTILSLMAGLATAFGAAFLLSDPREALFNAAANGDSTKIRALCTANRFDDATMQGALGLALFYRPDDKQPGQAAIELFQLMTPRQIWGLEIKVKTEAYATSEPRMSNGVMIVNHPISHLERMERIKVLEGFKLLEKNMTTHASVAAPVVSTPGPTVAPITFSPKATSSPKTEVTATVLGKVKTMVEEIEARMKNHARF